MAPMAEKKTKERSRWLFILHVDVPRISTAAHVLGAGALPGPARPRGDRGFRPIWEIVKHQF